MKSTQLEMIVPTLPNPAASAFVVKIGDRYFRKFSRARLCTAWSLAGSRLFLAWSDVDAVLNRLESRRDLGRRPITVRVIENDGTAIVGGSARFLRLARSLRS